MRRRLDSESLHAWGAVALADARAAEAAGGMADSPGPIESDDEDEAYPRDGFSEVIWIPSPQLTLEERELWRRVRVRTLLRLPPTSRAELLIRETRRALCLLGYSQKVTIPTLFAGISLALAKVTSITIKTPLRGLARDLGVRYSTLLLVRRTALVQIERLGPVLELGIDLPAESGSTGNLL